jgi:hypothetical protein
LDIDGEVVPIQSLYFEDDGPHVLEAGSPPSIPGQMGQMEFVAHGEHLCQVADGLERARWDTQREIRTISLKSTLRSLTAAKGTSLAGAVSAFASVALEAVGEGILERNKAGFVAQLREAGTTLSGATQTNEPAQVAKLTTVTEELRNLPEAAAVAPADGPLSRPVAPSAAMPVGMETLEPPPEPAVKAAEPAEIPEPPPEPAAVDTEPPADESQIDIAASWAAFEDLRSRFGAGEPSIEELIAGVPAEPEVAVEEELISITELCYSGSAALVEAHSVRDRIRSQLAESDWDAVAITDLIDELLDLVELGVGQP